MTVDAIQRNLGKISTDNRIFCNELIPKLDLTSVIV